MNPSNVTETTRVGAFSPRVALVTGASQGLGRAIALRLAGDGINVAVNDLPKQEDVLNEVIAEIESLGRKSVAVLGDVADETQVKNMVLKTVEVLGSLDIMIANAGIGNGGLLLLDMDTSMWDRVMGINIRGAMLCYKYAAQQMVKQGRGGRIMGASSICGKKGYTNLTAYCASKFAIVGLTQSFALEMLPYRITVNAYCPGLIKTPMSANEGDKELGEHGSVAKRALGIPSEIPAGEPEDIASIVSYICKPEASYITGQSLVVAGGAYLN